MPGKEYKAKDKTVQKISKDGLTEENLRSGETSSISSHVEDNLHQARGPDIRKGDAADGKADNADKLMQKNHRQLVRTRDGSDELVSVGDSESVSGQGKNNNRTYEHSVRTDDRMEETAKESPSKTTKAREKMIAEQPEDEAVSVESRVSDQSRRMKGVTEGSRMFDNPEDSREPTTGDGSRKYLKNSRRMEALTDETGAGDESAPGLLEKAGASEKLQDTVPVETADLGDYRGEIRKKGKREQVRQAQPGQTLKSGQKNSKNHAYLLEENAGKKSRLSFDDEASGMVRGNGSRLGKRAAALAAGSAAAAVHHKIQEDGGDNIALDATHKGEMTAEGVLHEAGGKRKTQSRSLRQKSMEETTASSSRLKFESGKSGTRTAQKATAETSRKKRLQKQWQKRRYQKAYAAAAKGKTTKEAVRATETFAQKARRAIKVVVTHNKGILIGVGVIIVICLLLGTALTSCSTIFAGVENVFVSTTYPSTDTDIYAVEDAYAALEDALQSQINNMESTHPGYDEYNYQIDAISHNPYLLISYFSARYGGFTYNQVSAELEEIFEEEYSLTLDSEHETRTTTRTVTVGESLGQVVTSGYCNCSICCGSWAGGPTASGVYPTSSHTIAVDAYNPIVPIGTKVVMNGVEYTVEDTGNLNAYGVNFDVYYDSHSAATAHGHQTWEAYLADDNGSQSVQVTVTEDVYILNVTLTNQSLDTILRNRMSSDELTRYTIYNQTYGNRDYLFDTSTLATGDFLTYDIPSEALSDQKFANMITEAEKYLGYPYVWGGYSPSTGFDCSGFVSYVINNCGNGWSYGRLTANGLMGICDIIPASEAQPGDLVFFQGTYNTSGASHVGIYVGNGMMIHCGNPISYTSINTNYWQSHLYCFGRIR